MKSVSDLKLNYVIQKIKAAFCPKDHTHNYAGSDTPGGNAKKANEADKLSTPRMINVDLSNNEDNLIEFDGSKDAVGGVTGILSVENGGTGCSTPEEFKDSIGLTIDPATALVTTMCYEGSGDPIIFFDFPDGFNPHLIMIFNPLMGGNTLNIVGPLNGGNSDIDGMWGFGLNSLDNEYLNVSQSGNKIKIGPSANMDYDEAVLQLYNRTAHNYILVAFGTADWRMATFNKYKPTITYAQSYD